MPACFPVTCELPTYPAFVSEENVFKAALKFFNITMEDLLSKKRDREFVTPRQIVMSILYNNTKYSLKAIGNIFNRRHATVIHSKNVVSDLLSRDSAYHSKYTEFCGLLYRLSYNKDMPGTNV